MYHPIQHEWVNLGITSGIQFNEVVLNSTSDAQIDPRVLYWVKYTDLEGWVLVIHYYTKRDPTNLALLDEMVKIFCSFQQLINQILEMLTMPPPLRIRYSFNGLFECELLQRNANMKTIFNLV